MSHTKIPLEIKEMITNYVEDIPTKYNIFQACPDLWPAIRKKPVTVELPLQDHLLQWVKEEELIIDTLVIKDTKVSSNQLSDLKLNRVTCVVEKCTVLGERFKLWKHIYPEAKETVERIIIHNFHGLLCRAISMFRNLKELRIYSSKEETTLRCYNLSLDKLFSSNLEKIYIQENNVELSKCFGHCLVKEDGFGFKFGGLYRGCPKLKSINNIKLPDYMVGEDRVDEKTFVRKMKAIILMKVKEENSRKLKTQRNKS